MRIVKPILILVMAMMSILQVKAQCFQMSDLVGKTWVATSGYNGCENIDWSMKISKGSSEHKFIVKENKQSSVFTYKTYLSTTIPQKYDASLVGKNENGKYLVFERNYTYNNKVYEDFYYAEIISLVANKLTLRVKNSTIVFVGK